MNTLGANLESDVLKGSIYYRLFDEAERVRWRVADIPWSSIEENKVTEETISVVKEVVFSELTTFSAAERFFTDFADDVDFTQWVALWLYEETKHPQVLMRWLTHFGVSFTADFMQQGRKTYPLMKSRMSTLVLNILSEMTASAAYLRLHSYAQEPVLKLIARNLASDEARHASSFYCYAKKMLDQSKTPEVERRQAIVVPLLWLMKTRPVNHPINQLYHRVQDEDATQFPNIAAVFDSEELRNRMCMMIGNLVGKPLASQNDIMVELSSKRNASSLI